MRRLLLLAVLAAALPPSAAGQAAAPPTCTVERAPTGRGALLDSIREAVRGAFVSAAAAEGVPVADGLVLLRRPVGGATTYDAHRMPPSPALRGAAVAAFEAQGTRWPDSVALTVVVRAHAEAPSPGAEACPPTALNHHAVAVALQRWMDAYTLLAPEGERFRARYLVLVTRDGEMVFPSLSQSSGWAEFDAAVMRIGGTLRATPATLGGRPTDAWLVLPVMAVVDDG